MIGNGYQITGRRSAGEELPASDPVLPLINLSVLGRKMDSLRHFISDSVNSNGPISDEQIRFASSEIASAVHDIIFNGAALVAAARPPMLNPHPIPPKLAEDPDPIRPGNDEDGDEIMEIDAAELMADHVHVCEICGKGFKRDANLRMHMRAHGNRFRTLEALSRPEMDPPLSVRAHRFSCPVPGCRRNRSHQKFRPLNSVACVRSHFKRSHCPKTHSCDRCKKSFAVSGELKSHLRSCGERKWRCSCGTSFSRKDKLFGHVALFEGHSPAAAEEEEMGGEGLDSEFFDGLMEEIEGFGAIM